MTPICLKSKPKLGSNRAMNKFHHVFFLLLWLLILHGSGIFLFYNGFFLTRYEIDAKSTCDLSPSPIPIDTLNEHLRENDLVKIPSNINLIFQVSKFRDQILLAHQTI